MFLKEIELTQLMCFENVRLSFQQDDGSIRKWTVLLGENGTGKSALLQAIALVTSGSDALGDLLVSPADWVRCGAEEGQITATLVTQEMKERQVQLTIGRADTPGDVIDRNRDGLSLLDSALRQAERNYFVAGFGASRRIETARTRGTQPPAAKAARAESVATLFDPDAVLNPLESWAMDLGYYSDAEGADTVREVLRDFLPGIRFSRIDQEKRQILFETPDGVIPLRLLSDGYQSACAWVGDLLYRVTVNFEDYRSPLEARGLLLIDQVDLHLHPRWQRILFDFLDARLPNFQLVVTTQSPLTAQQAGPGQLHYLIREGAQIRVEQFGGDPRTLLVSQLMMTDAFGIESDESLQVQRSKARYRELRDRPQLDDVERDELQELTSYLSERPAGGHPNLALQQEQWALLKKIEDELKERQE